VPFGTLRPDQKVKELTVPILVIHGARDQSVDSSHARILADGAGIEALILEDAGHNELLGSPEVVAPVLDFLQEAQRRS
jgi:pimeloyl-ACP methyl ester carboxylesterase